MLIVQQHHHEEIMISTKNPSILPLRGMKDRQNLEANSRSAQVRLFFEI